MGAIASLGGIIQGPTIIPKTRSRKTLGRVLRELLENAVVAESDKTVQLPATIEDVGVVDSEKDQIKIYIENGGIEEQWSSQEKARL